ncbi:hypothetical protein SAMN02745165_01429 [Malonomonas rubra DSM 5091]|uniref:Nucleoside transporter/FeoB GTPase Gate domain-containing protein n=1 Tax=Malonomonas rubra DSM 5091 TaxID=1122189 RepID=A0A1M6G6H7_MALRU|nr:nucleoside recognition domain-containing protein [Malonomonas rubra]SHJ05529.1 hypothetical protein SAMN02745165_01429 [Malonomonas rubra DSM 5091]
MTQKQEGLPQHLLATSRRLLLDALATSGMLFKIIIPISIVTRLLQQWGVVDQVGILLAPVMKLVGLPGEIGLVWATAMVTNLYGGMVVFASVAPELDFTVAQATIMTTMMLVAHALPVELKIAQKAGTRFRTMLLLRVGGALVLGWLLNIGYQLTGTLQQPNQALWNPPPVDPGWISWMLAEARNMVSIFLIILALMVLLEVLKAVGITALMTKLLEPILNLLGMGKEAAPLTIIGMTLGLGYGGALLIREAQSGSLSKQDVFAAFALLGICHSLIEDTLLMALLGGHASGILWARLFFALLITYLFSLLIPRLPHGIFERYLVRSTIADKTNAKEAGCC